MQDEHETAVVAAREGAAPVFDARTGSWIDAAEARFQETIVQERALNLIAVDAYYLEERPRLHAPLAPNETLSLSEEWWEVQRSNQGVVRVPANYIGGVSTPDILAARIAGAALGPQAEQVMLHLFALANANGRNPKLQVRLSDLLNRLGYTRDRRGVHYTSARRAVSRTLLGLHFTHVGLQRTEGRRHRRSVGFVAPLLAAVGYGPTAGVEGLSLQDVFEQALPEEVEVILNPAWYEGVREPSGQPGTDYALVPDPATTAVSGRRRGGRSLSRAPVRDLLRSYIDECRLHSTTTRVAVARKTLLEIAAIRDRKAWQAGQTLTRALDALCGDGTLGAYAPSPLPTRPDDDIVLDWTPALTLKRPRGA